jgi:23S rRNA (cytidine1920-2'-O)/16S rRNA (cytidine1409-2'-O)-methyltransferase
MRLDQVLVEQKLTETRSKSKDLITRGFVFVNGNAATKASYVVKPEDLIKIEKEIQFVSRGGDKLNQFLLDLNLDIKDNVCIDVGASTGGFTQVLLLRGAKHVITYDVGKHQMHPSLIEDTRVTAHESMNIMDVLIPKHDLMVIDVSFTSVIPILKHISNNVSNVIVLVKPQFEQLSQYKDVIRDDKMRLHILSHVKKEMMHLNYEIIASKDASIQGKKGNQETIFLLKMKGINA